MATAASFLVAGLIGLYLHYPAFQNPYIIHDDIRQSLNWIAYDSPGIFEGDLLRDYAEMNRAPILGFLYWLGTYFFDYVFLGKMYAILFFAFSGSVFFWVGREMGGWNSAVISFVFFTLIYDQFVQSVGGFSHGFMMPFTALTIYWVYKERWKTLALFVPLEVLVYPVAGVLTGLILLLDTIFYDWKRVFNKDFLLAKAFPLIIGACLSMGILFSKYIDTPEWYGHIVSLEEIEGRPEFTSSGRLAIMPRKGLTHELNKELNKPFFILSLFLFFIVFGRKIFFLPRGLWPLFLAAIIGYLLSDYFLLRLYLPDRYTQYPLPVFMIILMAFYYGKFLDSFSPGTKRILPLIFICFAGYVVEKPSLTPGVKMIHVRGPTLHRFLGQLPKDSLIAAPPYLADNIPVFSRRRVLFSYELSHPWITGYWKTMEERTYDYFDAYFSENKETVLRISKKHNITHWVIGRRDFNKKSLRKRTYYFEPFQSHIKKTTRWKRSFYLKTKCEELFLYKDINYCVVSTETLNR